jgi:hypothetical protein
MALSLTVLTQQLIGSMTSHRHIPVKNKLVVSVLGMQVRTVTFCGILSE